MTDGDKKTTGSKRPPQTLEDLVEQIDSETAQPGAAAPVFEPQAETDATPREQFIRFDVAGIRLVIPLKSACEIGPAPPVTPLPNLPEWIRGIANIRGEIISVVDLKGFFELSAGQGPAEGRIIVIRNEEMKTAVLVDRIAGSLSTSDVRPRPEEETYPYVEGTLADFICGSVYDQGMLRHLFDVKAFLSCRRMTAFGGD